MKNFTRNIAIAALVTFAPLSAQADFGQWGAVAVGDNSDGYSYGLASEAAARQVALKACGGKCGLVFAFNNKCGAIATGKKDGWGYGTDKSEDAARKMAVSYCKKQTSDCAVRVSACSIKSD